MSKSWKVLSAKVAFLICHSKHLGNKTQRIVNKTTKLFICHHHLNVNFREDEKKKWKNDL